MAGLLLIVGLAGVAHAQAAGAPDFVDGAGVQAQAYCLLSGAVGDGELSKVGYFVDPIAETPQLGQVTYIHALTTNRSTCAGDIVDFEVFLPPGAHYAISAQNPVHCYIGNGAGTQGDAPTCLQQPQLGPNGGRMFGSVSGLSPSWAYEIKVPIVFDQVMTGALLRVRTRGIWDTEDASVAVTAPFQPTPNPGAIGDDLALLGGASTGDTLPIAFSNDNGTFTVTSYPVGELAAWARTPNVQRLSGDFNGDGRTDYALVGGAGWNTIPVAMSLGNGQFTISNAWVGNFGGWAGAPGVTALTGDFNHDGHTDIALVGGVGSSTIPIAFSTGGGTFNVTNTANANFASWAAAPGARAITGDFNKDGFADIALVGGPGWTTLPVAFSYGDGSFLVTNKTAASGTTFGVVSTYVNFASFAREPNAHLVSGDFNKDGYADLAVVGGSGSGSRYGAGSIILAMSYGDGSFLVTASSAGQFGTWAEGAGVQVVTGDFNKDGYTDLALSGGLGWSTIPVAFSAGQGTFTLTNLPAPSFASWASTPGVRIIPGDFNGDGFTDLALTGGSGWTTIPVAMNAGSGNFTVTNAPTSRFPAWAAEAAAKVLAGRFH